MKYLKLFIIMLSLSIPIHSYACWDDDWDDDCHNGWYGDNDWNDDDDLEDDSYDLSGGMLPDVDVYPDDWGYDGWEDDDYWWCSDDDYINGDDDSWVDEDYDFNYNESNNIDESANIVEDTNANTYSLKKSDKLSLE